MSPFAAALALALALSVAAAPDSPAPPRRDPERDEADPIDVADYPAEQQERFALFRQKCTRCHSLSVALGTPFTPAVWKRHQKRPNAALTEEQAQAIHEFMKFHAARKSTGERARCPLERGLPGRGPNRATGRACRGDPHVVTPGRDVRPANVQIGRAVERAARRAPRARPRGMRRAEPRGWAPTSSPQLRHGANRRNADPARQVRPDRPARPTREPGAARPRTRRPAREEAERRVPGGAARSA
jgi:hypothetical protein